MEILNRDTNPVGCVRLRSDGIMRLKILEITEIVETPFGATLKLGATRVETSEDVNHVREVVEKAKINVEALKSEASTAD